MDSSSETMLHPILVTEIPIDYFPGKIRLDRLAARNDEDEEQSSSIEGHLLGPIKVGKPIVVAFHIPAMLHESNGEHTQFGELHDSTSVVRELELYLGSQGIANVLVTTRNSVWMLQILPHTDLLLENMQKIAEEKMRDVLAHEVRRIT